MKIVLVTGGFDPIHSGHIDYLKEAKKLGDTLVVGINSDEWLQRKKGQSFMPWDERCAIISNLHMVDRAIDFDDSDGSAIDAITYLLGIYGSDTDIIFANGGDRTRENIPEMKITDSRVKFEFSVGGNYKKNSSSWILEEWRKPKTNRPWGYYRILHEQGKEVKVKELTVDPGQRLSMQRHTDRAEHWFVSEGTATVNTINDHSTDKELLGVYTKFQTIHISNKAWHQLCNKGDTPLKVIEIQYGNNCVEEDIERI